MNMFIRRNAESERKKKEMKKHVHYMQIRDTMHTVTRHSKLP